MRPRTTAKPPVDLDDLLLDAWQVADLAGCDVRTVHANRIRDELPCEVYRGRYRFTVSTALEFAQRYIREYGTQASCDNVT